MKEEIMIVTIVVFFIITFFLLFIIRIRNIDIKYLQDLRDRLYEENSDLEDKIWWLEKKVDNRDKAINRLKQRLLRRNRKINKLTSKI